MKTALTTVAVLLAFGLGAQDALAQGAMLRGKVVDAQGRPLAEVKVEMTVKGKEPKTFVRMTNEKGGFIQVGMPDGMCSIHFTKEGFAPYVVELYVALGPLNDLPIVTLKEKAGAAPPAQAPPAAAPTGAPAGAPAGSKDKVMEAFAKAREATKAGRLDESEALYREILTTVPDLAEAHFNLGLLYVAKKDWAQAETELKRVVELQPEKSDTYSALASVYDATDRHADALALLTEAGARFDGDPVFQYNLGVTCLNGGRAEAATAAFRKALALDPSRVEAHFYLGTMAIGAGNVAEAVTELETYVSATGQSPQNLATAKKLLETLKSRPK